MLRSLNSGVTGLLNHQVRMDVLGNNIANVNTIGYKNRRVTFEESFNQLMKGASRTESKAGGTNPMQVGLGVAVGSIDVVTGQGALQNTGRIFDLAIEGNAFFGVSDGTGTFYTRNGAFQLDAEGYIILPTNGMVLQGKMADTKGVFPPGAAISNLQIPLNQQTPAKETTEVSIGRNLNMEGYAKGSVSYTQQFLHSVYESPGNNPDGSIFTGGTQRPEGVNGANDPGQTTPTLLTSLHDEFGNYMDIKRDDVISISWYNQASYISGETPPANSINFVVREPDINDPNAIDNRIWNIDDLCAAIQSTLNAGDNGFGINNAFTVGINAKGQVEITGNGQAFNLTIETSNPSKKAGFLPNAFNAFGNYISDVGYGNYPASIYGNVGATSLGLLRPAEQFDYISELKNSDGQALYPGLEDGDSIDIFGTVGKNSIEEHKSDPLNFLSSIATMRDIANPAIAVSTPGSSMYNTADANYDPRFDSSDPAYDPQYVAGNRTITITFPDPLWEGDDPRVGTLLDDLLAKMRNDLLLSVEYMDVDGNGYSSVSMNPAGTDDGIPAGAIVVRGTKGKLFDINNLAIRATNANSNNIAPTLFNAATGVTKKRDAEDVETPTVTIPVYDEGGAEHMMTITFMHTGKSNEWEWRASFAGKEDIMYDSGTGKVTFGQDNTVSSWTYDSGGGRLIVEPHNGSKMMQINLDIGGPGNFTGITQFAAESTVQYSGQDGYPTGNLLEVSIDEFGLIEGVFSNGVSRAIAQIMVVDFANPGGLLDLSESIYTLSANSGDPIWGQPKKQSSSAIKPGALEISNVDIATEFTNMITTQRGYQSNSRIITVSDTMLEEAVNLKR